MNDTIQIPRDLAKRYVDFQFSSNEELRDTLRAQLAPSDAELRATCLRGDWLPEGELANCLSVYYASYKKEWDITSHIGDSCSTKPLKKLGHIFFSHDRRDLADEKLREIKGEAMPSVEDVVCCIRKKDLSIVFVNQKLSYYRSENGGVIYFYSEKAMLRFIEEHRPKVIQGFVEMGNGAKYRTISEEGTIIIEIWNGLQVDEFRLSIGIVFTNDLVGTQAAKERIKIWQQQAADLKAKLSK